MDGMVDLFYGEIDLPSSGADWKTAMRQQAISTRDVLSRHRWAISLMESRTKPGPANLRYHDSVIRSLREAGFSIAMAIHAFSLMDSYIYGFALQELTLPFDTSEELTEVAESILRQFPSNEYPHLAETIVEHVSEVRLRLRGRVRVRARSDPRWPREGPGHRLRSPMVRVTPSVIATDDLITGSACATRPERGRQ